MSQKQLQSFVLKKGDPMIFNLQSVYKFVRIYLTTGENQTFKIKKCEKFPRFFIIHFDNFNVMIDSNDNNQIESIFMPNNKVKHIEFLTTDDPKNLEPEQVPKKLLLSASSSSSSLSSLPPSSSNYYHEPFFHPPSCYKLGYNPLQQSLTPSTKIESLQQPLAPSTKTGIKSLQPLAPSTKTETKPPLPSLPPSKNETTDKPVVVIDEKEVSRLKIKYKVLRDFVECSCYILQNCASAWWLARHPLMDGLDFIDCGMLTFDSRSDMQHYIDSVYRPFALKQLQKGTEYTYCKYHFSNLSTGSKASFYILDLERIASRTEPWTYFETYLVTRDGYCYPVKDAKEAFKIYSLQNKYNQNHGYVYSNKELDEYIALMKFFTAVYLK